MNDKKKSNQEFINEYIVFRDKLAIIEPELEKLKVSNKQLKDNLQAYKDEIKDLKSYAYNMNQANKDLKIEKSSVETKHEKQQEFIEQLKKENRDKQEKLNNQSKHLTKIQFELDEINKENENLLKTVEEVLKEQRKIEIELDRVKDQSTLEDLKIEASNYIKGMFESYDFETGSLQILINGTKYYYPLSNYKCEYLPLSGSRVFIFKDTENQVYIYGFDMSRMIALAKSVLASVKSILPMKNTLKLLTKEFGYIDVLVSNTFLEKTKINSSESLKLKQTYIDGNLYFSIEDSCSIDYNKQEILNLIKGK